MLKLTELQFDMCPTVPPTENAVWIERGSIKFMRRYEEPHPQTRICLGAPDYVYVKETPDEITAMLVRP